jgi:prepilin-type N-terminal cleavage/methylation domain-containing protein
MKSKSGGVPILGRAFTLIELLIVVAIIAILAAIAVPNFLEAQARAKISRAKTDLRTMHIAVNAYQVDWNDCLRDANDADTPPDLKTASWSTEHPGQTADMIFTVNQNYYTFRQWRPLSTPVAYVTFQPVQGAFSHNVPYGQDTREIGSGRIVYWTILCGGVDRTNGDWYRGNNSPANLAIPYDPTNGTVSRGDIWRGESMASTAEFRTEYGPWPMSP